MSKLQDFMKLLTGNFDNREQWESLRETNPDFPLARHVNTACNDKIAGLPQGFSGEFMVEESYFTAKGTTHASNHLFLFTEEEGGHPAHLLRNSRGLRQVLLHLRGHEGRRITAA